MSDSTQQVEKVQQQEQPEMEISQTHPELTPLHIYIGQNAGTLVKLVGFSAALFAFPIVTFFTTLHSLFDGNTTYAAGAAALMANVVVILYIITAMLEKPRKDDKKEEKKDQ